jgi:hypothetical protein
MTFMDFAGIDPVFCTVIVKKMLPEQVISCTLVILICFNGIVGMLVVDRLVVSVGGLFDMLFGAVNGLCVSAIMVSMFVMISAVIRIFAVLSSMFFTIKSSKFFLERFCGDVYELYF